MLQPPRGPPEAAPDSAALAGWRSSRSNVDQLETLLPRSVGEPIVERDDLERRRTAFGGKEGRCKLQRVGCPQRMNTKKPERVLADDLAGFNLVPPAGEAFQPIEGQRSGFPLKQSAAFEAGQSRRALHL